MAGREAGLPQRLRGRNRLRRSVALARWS
ncbi:hypothetical protein Esi_0172_0036 [Ectocarpus siliculosus]|uniref:Uncharacterized protein n=1 Tax=Ectocarpus siliculosus TaxID=2880 RepID=D7FMY9_ECTSI|nr:hypothetical protein Esi_0172_0036 [Ectocarpus siliculosus]|eukprot:CBJ30053.1 hypothetical protein Esi_0172_0036 [Ectocarpus siliculosus]